MDARVVKAASVILNAVSRQSFFGPWLPVKSSTGVAFGFGSLLTDGPLAHRLPATRYPGTRTCRRGLPRASKPGKGGRARSARMVAAARVTGIVCRRSVWGSTGADGPAPTAAAPRRLLDANGRRDEKEERSDGKRQSKDRARAWSIRGLMMALSEAKMGLNGRSRARSRAKPPLAIRGHSSGVYMYSAGALDQHRRARRCCDCHCAWRIWPRTWPRPRMRSRRHRQALAGRRHARANGPVAHATAMRATRPRVGSEDGATERKVALTIREKDLAVLQKSSIESVQIPHLSPAIVH